MQQSVQLHRLARPRFNRYETDGCGRDTYISYNNGGFCSKDAKEIKGKSSYPIYHKYTYHSLGHSAAPFRYYSDGSGRDSYILDHDGGLTRCDKPLADYHLEDFLRTADQCIYTPNIHKTINGVRTPTVYLGKAEWNRNQFLKNHQKNLNQRLYTQPMEMVLKLRKMEDKKNKIRKIKIKNEQNSQLKEEQILGKNLWRKYYGKIFDEDFLCCKKQFDLFKEYEDWEEKEQQKWQCKTMRSMGFKNHNKRFELYPKTEADYVDDKIKQQLNYKGRGFGLDGIKKFKIKKLPQLETEERKDY